MHNPYSNPDINSNDTQIDVTDWLPVSDMMSGLMMIFLFVAVIVARGTLEPEEPIAQQIEPVESTQPEPIKKTLHEKIYTLLSNEFANDLANWSASISEKDLTLSFHRSNGMFDTGLALLNPQYDEIFADFYPRYIKVIEPFVDDIVEIRVEGHTSSGWQKAQTAFDAYINNLQLSQNRAFSVLKQLSEINADTAKKVTLFSKFTSLGFASAYPVFDENGLEDTQASRRVAFRVVLPAPDITFNPITSTVSMQASPRHQ